MPYLSIRVVRILALVSGCIAMMPVGAIYSFAAYANALKKHFNYTQPQIEVLSSASNMGLSLGFSAGLVYERFGGRWTSFLALIISLVGYSLLWSTAMMKDVYSGSYMYILQAVYFFLTGVGATFLYMAILLTNMSNFQTQCRGTIVSLLDTFFTVGVAIFSKVYFTYFVNGHLNDEENQDLKGYYLMNAIVFAIVGIIGICASKNLSFDDRETLLPPSSTVAAFADVTGIRLLKRWDFHALFWAFMICTSVEITIMNNIGVILKSQYLVEHTSTLITLHTTTNVLFKLLIAFFSDRVIDKIPRVGIIAPCHIVLTVLTFLGVYFIDSLGFLILLCIWLGLSSGSLWCLMPTIISEYYGMHHFGRNWGWTMFIAAIGAFLTQELFGWAYDQSISAIDANDCYGIKCFSWSFGMATLVTFIASILFVALIVFDLHRRKQYTDDKDEGLTPAIYYSIGSR